MAHFARIARTAVLSGSRLLQTNYRAALQVPVLRNFSCSSILAEKKFSEQHEWVDLNGNVARIGISEHAQDALGDIVFVELPPVGDSFSKDDNCGVVESVKAVSEIFSPVSGTISNINQEVVDEPGLINKSCMDKGWLFEMELSNPEEMNDLMSEEAYAKFLKDQE